jgi:DNA ligase-1
MKLAKLYKKTSTGQIQYWQIEAEGNFIVTRYGKEGGKEMVAKDMIREGKNTGRANATDSEEQAKREAQSQWEAKIKKGYVENIVRAKEGETDHDGGWFPMLAHQFSEQGHKIIYPAFVQPKLDGHRCVSDKAGKLWTRTRKPYVSVPHIQKAIPLGVQLDGELYNHAYHDSFEKISHLVNQQTEPAEGHEVVEYHVYDVNMPGSFAERCAWLKKNLPHTKPFVLVETIEVSNEDELMDAFDHYLSLGYEGAIVRNAGGVYEGKRSYDLQKIKEFDDAEFDIIGIEEGRGKLQGHAGKFICKTKDGTEFGAKAKGELSKLKEYFEDHSLWKGKQLTVQYQGLTGKNKVPRFPVGLRFR